jgi:hypothetical protein
LDERVQKLPGLEVDQKKEHTLYAGAVRVLSKNCFAAQKKTENQIYRQEMFMNK